MVAWWTAYKLQNIRYVNMSFRRWMNFNRQIKRKKYVETLSAYIVRFMIVYQTEKTEIGALCIMGSQSRAPLNTIGLWWSAGFLGSSFEPHVTERRPYPGQLYVWPLFFFSFLLLFFSVRGFTIVYKMRLWGNEKSWARLRFERR